MGIIEVAGALVTGVMSGGATGLIGLLIQGWSESRKRAQDIELLKVQHLQTLELRKIDAEQQVKMATMDAASAERLAELEAMARADESANASLRASYDHDRATYLDSDAQKKSRVARWMMGLVDFTRGIIRPGITAYSMVILSALALWVQNLFLQKQIVLTPDQTFKLVMEVIGTITYITTTSVVWWFGARANQKK